MLRIEIRRLQKEAKRLDGYMDTMRLLTKLSRKQKAGTTPEIEKLKKEVARMPEFEEVDAEYNDLMDKIEKLKRRKRLLGDG